MEVENNHRQTQRSDLLKKQEGFAVIFLLSLLPLILAATTFLYIGTCQLEMKSTMQKTCRAEFMKVQDSAARHIKTLLELNKFVDLIKWGQFVAAVTAAISFIMPPLKPIFMAILKSTKNAKEALPRLQKAVLLSLESTMRGGLLMTQKKLSLLIRDYQRRTAGLLAISNSWFVPRSSFQFSVEAEDPRAQLTKYRLKQKFEELQTLTLLWGYSLQTDSPLWRWASWKQSFRSSCSVTLERGPRWQPTLIADKFLLKL